MHTNKNIITQIHTFTNARIQTNKFPTKEQTNQPNSRSNKPQAPDMQPTDQREAYEKHGLYHAYVRGSHQHWRLGHGSAFALLHRTVKPKALSKLTRS